MSRVHNLASSSFKSIYSEKLSKSSDSKGKVCFFKSLNVGSFQELTVCNFFR